MSVVILIFDDDSDNAWNRQKVLERISMVNLPASLQPQIGPDFSPVGQIYFYTLRNTNPAYDAMELKSLQDWVLVKQFKTVPNVVDVSSFGGPTREYQVRVDPAKLVSYGLSIGQVEQQLANNNVNAGGSFIEAGTQQINVRAVGLVATTSDIERTVITAKNGTPVRVRDIATVSQGPKIRLGQFGRAIHREDGKIIDNQDVVSGIVLMRKGADFDSTLEAVHKKIAELNNRILPPGVKVVPFNDRSDLVHHTTHTVLRNLSEGLHPRHVRAAALSRECPGRPDRGAHHPLLAPLRVDLPRPPPYTGEPALLRRPRLRHGRRRDGRDGGEHHPPPGA